MTPGIGPERRESGYALVAAVASIAFFALVALAVLAATQRAIVSGGAEIEEAQAAAAAEAGVAMAIHGLLADDLIDSWSIDGRVRRLRFDRAGLAIRIVDERGKIPLNIIEPAQIGAMLTNAGLTGAALRIARDSLQDWTDDDDEPRADGAELGFYRARGIRPRNGSFLTIDELARVRGFDAALVEQLRPYTSVDFGAGVFSTRFAQPAAIGVMYGGGEVTPEAIARAREAAGQVTALGFTAEAELIARPLSVEVVATLPGGARARRRCVIELTGNEGRPYVIRNCE